MVESSVITFTMVMGIIMMEEINGNININRNGNGKEKKKEKSNVKEKKENG